MKTISRWLLSVGALASVLAASPAGAQPYGYYDDGPRPFHRGPGWDGPPRGPWDRWHRRHWRGDDFGGPGWRRDGRRAGRDGFGDEGRGGRFRDDDRRGRDDARRGRDDEDASRRGGPGRRSFGDDGN